ncbi:hyoscyamine 6-dioxygenase [Phtheirospermum japonicum]|uniref:Hyoscyamine 6-dioxygenase n=1 Tax=Phtheirospermum japonicum TaxID=374723 RepID=A0A830D1D9_9LAMI|nr:hyoscyamine 6-dioxygenase [Phtheirospermum japonicum]
MGSVHKNSYSFPIGETAQERGFSHVPECYKVQTSQRALSDRKMTDVPQIDLEGMSDSSRRSVIVDEIAVACRRIGFFQVVNHGIPEAVLEGALSTASDFFKLPAQDKAKFMSSDLYNPVRYCTSLKDGVDKVQFWRIFLKQYAHPLQNWIGLWPDTPSDYRKKMGDYAVAVQKLAVNIMGAITESLGLGPSYPSGSKLKDGSQVMVVNCYPPCPQPELTLGLPPHSDYSCFTILLQDSFGLEILDPEDKTWKGVPVTRGALQVHIGDHLEVLSNGEYKSVVHKATLNSQRTRISLASLHSLGMDEKMEAAEELVDEDNPRGYRASSFRDFLDFMNKNDIGDGSSFLETLKIHK